AVAAVGAAALAAKAGGETPRPEPLGGQEQVSGEDETSVNQNNMEQFEAGKPHEALTDKPEDEKEEEEEAPEPKKEPVPPTQEAVSLTAEQEKDIERKNRVRAAVWYTIEKLKDYSELLTSEDGRKLTTEKERQERFIELIKKHWKEFTTHGTYNAREIDPATGKAAVEKYMDLDAGACVFLLKQAGIEVDTDAVKINYVPQGHTADTGVVIDTSDEFGVTTDKEGKKLTIDHHTSEPLRDASSTRFLYELLSNSDMGLLEKDPWLEKFVAYVTKEDNKNYTDEEARDVWENYGRNFVSLAKENMTFEEMKKFFEDGKYTPYERLPDAYLKKLSLVFNAGRGELQEQKLNFAVRRLEGYKKEALERIQRMEQQGFVLDSGDSRFGRILIDTGWETDDGDWLKKNRFEID
ncbi:MAG: hypothetical protein U1C18_01275, partial [Patescibacteria group bacterium]|nr:hypothetical protein [Patescibacteria group bacterium]